MRGNTCSLIFRPSMINRLFVLIRHCQILPSIGNYFFLLYQTMFDIVILKFGKVFKVSEIAERDVERRVSI